MPNWTGEVKVKRGDFGYSIWFRLQEEIITDGVASLVPVDLSFAEEINLICKVGSSPALVLGPLDPEAEDGDDTADWENGILGYIVEQPDFTEVSKFEAEIEVIAAAGGRITWPNEGFCTIDVGRDLGDAV